MKEKILERLEQHALEILEKDEITNEELNFLVFWLGRVESDEQKEAMKKRDEEYKIKQEENNKELRKHILELFGKI